MKCTYNYILIWVINGYDGGTEFDIFKTEEELIEKVTDIGKNGSVLFCGQLRNEIELEPVETVTKWKIKN